MIKKYNKIKIFFDVNDKDIRFYGIDPFNNKYFLIWVVEKINNPTIYDDILNRQNKNNNNLITKSGIYWNRKTSNKLNKDFENYHYNNEFIEIIETYKTHIEKLASITYEKTLLNKYKNDVFDAFSKIFNSYFCDNNVYLNNYFLKIKPYDYINKKTFESLLYKLSSWFYKNSSRGLINTTKYGKLILKDKKIPIDKLPKITLDELDTIRFIFNEMLYIIKKIKMKSYLDDNEIKQYDHISKMLTYDIDIKALNYDINNIETFDFDSKMFDNLKKENEICGIYACGSCCGDDDDYDN